MKNTLMAFAGSAALAAGPAFAQSSVTLFGIVDATLAHGSGSISSKTQLTTSGYNSSRLGFRGTEDLGGGMSASFWLEVGVGNDDGRGVPTNVNNQASGGALAGLSGGQGLTFNRRSTVSLAGSWGEVRLGRDFTPQYGNLGTFDPFGNNGMGTSQTFNSIITGVTAVRASNSIAYFLPANIGGFYGQAAYYMGENSSGAATSDDGKGQGVRLGYLNGPLNVAFAVSKTSYATATPGGSGFASSGRVRQNNLGGRYDFGVAQLMAQYSNDRNGALTGSGYVVGGTAAVGAGQIRIAFSRYKNDAPTNPASKKWALGYVHNLSKRTALYGTYARVANSGSAAQSLGGAVTAAGTSSSGYEFGIRHSF
ncbi:MAG: porin [Ramlibacter sp.]|nr:porin [Ramlibacter sp.]